MKTMTCRDLGGACDTAFPGDSLEAIGKLCQVHVMEMMTAGDQPHIDAVEAWKAQTPEQQQVRFAQWQETFEAKEGE